MTWLKADTVTSVIALAVAGYIAHEGHALDLGTASNPGSGFILFWTGLIMAGLSSGVLIGSLTGSHPGFSLGSVFQDSRWGKVLYVVALLAIHAALLETLGFVITTFALLVVLFKTVEPQGWGVSVLGAFLTTAAAWGVFVAWLGTQLPTGIFEIG
jgi:putative tricarboxylic transport membrane protein